MNPVGFLVIAIGVVAIILGWNGRYKQAFAMLTGASNAADPLAVNPLGLAPNIPGQAGTQVSGAAASGFNVAVQSVVNAWPQNQVPGSVVVGTKPGKG